MPPEIIAWAYIVFAMLVVCWPSRKWDVRGLLEEDEQ